MTRRQEDATAKMLSSPHAAGVIGDANVTVRTVLYAKRSQSHGAEIFDHMLAGLVVELERDYAEMRR